MGLDIEGAVQQAPQSGRHSIMTSARQTGADFIRRRLETLTTFSRHAAKAVKSACLADASRVICRDIFAIPN
jgi:elongation factor P